MAAKILILDDDPALVDSLREVLEDAGYDASSKVERVFADVLQAKPDLLLIDAPPTLEGQTLNFIQRVRLKRETAKLPIILLTTSLRFVEPGILREQRIHVLVKPFDLDDFLASIEMMLPIELRRHSAA